ncbi:tetratricopeptide repeat protein [Pseudenhygromyxa sp. WMMC2535]|uniref:tetratricopeptide repeat protein n=1 Tax=Pseudenhygromyxa sp. WMMC2535 TaxID=2712867 RepID=UPI00159520C3|nr:tetratricopeptide repeat protein [Pseudenhygromyxa sp. WMMC2535]NVB42711.1 tetratricopeptide repeat protein [Pseudenhygromyxa sp. WMMC2535]
MTPARLRSRSLALAVLLAVVGCKRDADTQTPGDEAAAGEGAGGAGDAGAAQAGEGVAVDAGLGELSEEIEQAPTGPRERERPADPQTRDAALIAVAHGNPEGAIAFLSEHLAGSKDDHEARLALARAQRLVSDYDAAQASLETVRKRAKDKATQAEALRRLAHLRERRGDFAGAEKHLRAALKLVPDDLLLTGELVREMFLVGRAGESEIREMIDELYAAYGDGRVSSAEQLLGASHAALAERAFKSTSRVLQEAEEAAPASAGSQIADEIALQLASLFLEKYQPGEAAQTLALVLERDPWQPEALAMMAWVALDDFRLADASNAAEETLMVAPQNPDAHAALAWVAMIEGRREEARARVVDHVLGVDPAHAGGQAVMAALALFERDDAAYKKAREAVLGARPTNGEFYSGLGDLLGYLHLYPEADAILSEGVERLPNDPYVQGALGLSRLRLGDEAEGRAALERAWKKDKYNARTLNVRQLYAEHIEPHYIEAVHGDLTLRLPSELHELVEPGFVEAISAARRSLDAAYGVKISPLRIEIYADPEAFSVRTVGVPSLGAVGVCFGPMITSIGPYAGTHNFNQVIWHEIAHSYAISLSAGRVPRWFTEGLSEWESEVADPSWARESATLLYEARRAGKLRKLSELELAFLRAGSPIMMEVAYSTAAWAMRYLGTTYGRPKIIEMLRGYATGKSTEALFVEVLGKDMATVEAEFEAWFDAEIDRKLSGWRPSPDAKDDPRMANFEAAMQAGAAGEFDEAEAQLEALIAAKGDGYFARLGMATVLEGRGDIAGAVKEYERAAGFALETLDPLIAMARLARDQGDLARELDVLERILAIDAMSLQPAMRALVIAGAMDDKRFPAFVAQAQAIAPLHPTVAAGAALVAHRQGKSGKARAKALLDEAMGTALRPDATLDVVVMAALAAEAMGDPRAKDLAPRAVESKELPKVARDRLEKVK